MCSKIQFDLIGERVPCEPHLDKQLHHTSQIT